MSPHDHVYCYNCGTEVALVHDYHDTVDDLVNAGFFTEVYNVKEAQNEQYIKDGMTLAKAYCANCKKLLGWKLIAASQPSRSRRVGGFYLTLKEVSFFDDVTLHDQKRRDNEKNVDQGGGANEQNVYQGGGANEQNVYQGGGANAQNVDQGEGANEQNVDQGGGANEQNVDQGGGTNEQNVDQDGGTNEQNVVQDGGANEQNVDQDGGANEQNVDPDGGANGQNHDQDGGRPMKRPKI